MKKQMNFLFTLLLAASTAFAQGGFPSTGVDTLTLEKDTITELKVFSAVYNSGNVYLKWIVSNQHTDGTYVILRSTDNKTFDPIGFKEGVGVPVSSDIAYYFKDESPCHSTLYYRLLHIGVSPSYVLSKSIVILNIPELLCEAKNNQ